MSCSSCQTVAWTVADGWFGDIHAFQDVGYSNGVWLYHEVEMHAYNSASEIHAEYPDSLGISLAFGGRRELVDRERGKKQIPIGYNAFPQSP